MKRILFLFAILLLATPLLAQDDVTPPPPASVEPPADPEPEPEPDKPEEPTPAQPTDADGDSDGDDDESKPDDVVVHRYNWQEDLGIEPAAKFWVYSDLAGIDDDQPNGLLQTEGSISFPMNTNAFFWTNERDWIDYEDGDDKNGDLAVPNRLRRGFLFRNMVLGDIVMAKWENNNQDLPLRLFQSQVNPGDSIYGVNTLDMVQYADFKYTAKMNLATLQFFQGVEGCKHEPEAHLETTKGCNNQLKANDLYCRKHTLYLDLAARFMRNSIADTNVVLTDKTTNSYLNAQSYGWNLKWSFQQHNSRLGIEAYWQALYTIQNRPKSIFLEGSDTPVELFQINNDNLLNSGRYNNSATVGRLTNKWTSEIAIQISLADKESSGESTFFRFSFHGDDLLPGMGNNFFFQAQLGISKSIDEIFKKEE